MRLLRGTRSSFTSQGNTSTDRPFLHMHRSRQSSRLVRHATIDPEDLLTDAAYKVLRLRDVVFLQPPVEIRPLLGKLSFLRKTNRWGAALVGGCRSMTARDFRRVAPEASPRVGLAPNAPGFAGA